MDGFYAMLTSNLVYSYWDLSIKKSGGVMWPCTIGIQEAVANIVVAMGFIMAVKALEVEKREKGDCLFHSEKTPEFSA